MNSQHQNYNQLHIVNILMLFTCILLPIAHTVYPTYPNLYLGILSCI